MARVNRALHDFVCATGGACCCYFVEQIFCLMFLWKRKKIHMKYLYQIFPLAILWFGSHSRVLAGEKKYMYMYNFNEIISQTNEGHIKRKTENSKVFWVTKFCSPSWNWNSLENSYMPLLQMLFKVYEFVVTWVVLLGKRRSTVETLANSFYHIILFYQFFNIKFHREYDFCWCDHDTFRRNWVFIKFSSSLLNINFSWKLCSFIRLVTVARI